MGNVDLPLSLSLIIFVFGARAYEAFTGVEGVSGAI